MGWSSPDASADGVAAALAKRADLLDALAEAPRDQRALREALCVSRSTVYKGLRELEGVGLIERTDDGYALTQFGRLARRKHDAYRATVHRLQRARGVLDALSGDSRVPLAFVERGTVVRADEHAPERPMHRYEGIARDASRLRVLSPVALPRYMPVVHERVADVGDLTVEIATTPAAVEHLAVEYDRFDEALRADGLRVFAVDRQPEFGVTLVDDASAAVLAAYDGGAVRGLAVSRAPEACTWGRRVYRRYRTAASEVSAPGV